MTAITLGRVSPHRLGATYPPTLPTEPQGEEATANRGRSRLAYLVLLRAEIARFTLGAERPTWLWAFPACAGNPQNTQVALLPNSSLLL